MQEQIEKFNSVNLILRISNDIDKLKPRNKENSISLQQQNVKLNIQYYKEQKNKNKEINLQENTFKPSYTYTDQEFDSESGLMYYDARYYDVDLKRFLFVDPWGGDIKIPQTLNKYSYTVNNPIILVDPDGERLRIISRPVTFIGTHSFIEITNNPNINNNKRTTLGGYTNNFISGTLFKGENYHTDYDLSEEDYVSVKSINAPTPYTQQGFEEKVYQSYLDLDDNLGDYSFGGGDFYNGQANSGNVYTQILIDAGLYMEQIKSNKKLFRYDAGVGVTVAQAKNKDIGKKIDKLKSNAKTNIRTAKKSFSRIYNQMKYNARGNIRNIKLKFNK